MNKREKIVELFKNKPEAYQITFPANAVQYLIDSGFIQTLSAEELLEEPNDPNGVWACYLESLPQPEPVVGDPQVGEDN